MVFPEKALVVCSCADEVDQLRLFLVDNGYHFNSLNSQWSKKFPSYFRECNRRHEQTCYNLTLKDRSAIGWCYPEYYLGTDFENQEDSSWNYLSVSDYICKVLELNGVSLSVNVLDIL